MSGATITVVGEAGAIQTLDLPDEGTPARELLDHFIETGKYVLVDGDPTSADRPAESAAKADWVAYAGSLGIDTKGMSKPQVIASVDEQLVDADESSGPVDPDVPGEDLPSDPEELVPGEDDGADAGEQADGDVDGHEG